MRIKMLTLSCLLIAVLAAGAFGLYTIRARAAATAQDFYVPAGMDPWGTAMDSQGHIWVAVPNCDPEPTCGSNPASGKIEVFNPSNNGWMNTYTLPAGYGPELFLAIDASSNVWFALPSANAIGEFTPSTQTFQKWKVPTAASGPWDVAIDSKGLIWFTEHYTNKIGRFNPATHGFKEFKTPTANSLPYGLVIDKSNNIWFAENNTAKIGKFNRSTGKILEYTIRASAPSALTPHLLTFDPNGNLWWTEGWVGMIGELKVSQASPGTNQGVTEYTYPVTCASCSEHASGISVDSHGLIWFDDSLQSVYGSFPDTGTGSFTLYPTPTANSHPHDGLRVDGQNRIFFDEEFQNKLAVATQS